ncbi:type VII toxin-antitoxin system HepT family RNase toxin [Carboxydothermus ferrireducens]|uniref:Uncharacterized protein YutE (UPF0331/DUF86 family) n=1 Tax=Carboxydothermus ferrireducens DSM 11255 TaxID=1119529 RepID=A0ABX2RC24_9THEO|nr:DUF86 domain-containing protein [Carboxydothermus ferrireducens]NYE57613.1 uncharacterized protein YutE (UPF0331/DUF86 family) [Carboxydothermus ferrireducens DSM 11255]
MVNKVLIEGKLNLIIEYVNRLKELKSLPLKEFLEDYRNPATAESYLRRALEAVFDIGRHILAKSRGRDLSLEYKGIARGLRELGIVDENLGQKLMQMAGYRNRMVHLYSLVTDEELYEIIQNDLKDFLNFVNSIKEYLAKLQ